jgi:hypothetical protein
MADISNGSAASRDALFWLAVAHFHSGNISLARAAAVALVRSDARDERAAALLEIIKGNVRRRATFALAGVGVAITVIGVVTVAWTWVVGRRALAVGSRTVEAGATAGAAALTAAVTAAMPHGIAASDALRRGGRGVGREVGAAVGAAVEDSVIAARNALEDAWKKGTTK